MFAFQSSKRPRDHDDSDSDDERYLKKSRPWSISSLRNGPQDYPPSNLPLRPSFPPSPPQTIPSFAAVPPSHSDNAEPDSPASLQDDPYHYSLGDADADMEMDDNDDDADDDDDDDFDVVGSQPPDSPFIMRPPKLDANLFGRSPPANSSNSNNSARIPTPIYPNFHAPRAASALISNAGNGLHYPNSGFAGGSMSIPMSMSTGLDLAGTGPGTTTYLGIPSNPVLRTPPAPLTSSGPRSSTTSHYHPPDPQRAHRMPSPISEDEDLPDTPTSFAQSQLSRLSVTSNNTMELAAISEDADVDADMSPPPGVHAVPRSGRKRSGALSGIGVGGGMGRGRFSMGYREDCEKCRLRVPGHYSHFL